MDRTVTYRTGLAATAGSGKGGLRRATVIATMAFLTLVDLFAMQALLPTLIERYQVSAAAMGLAVNASTVGMAAASLATSLLDRRIDRRRGIALSLALLSLPTAALASAPGLVVFAALRLGQGLCMATAFTLMLAHLGERCDARESAGAFSAYIAGNVASNLVGRLLSAGISDHFGLDATFHALPGSTSPAPRWPMRRSRWRRARWAISPSRSPPSLPWRSTGAIGRCARPSASAS